jgi:hypothetical protein
MRILASLSEALEREITRIATRVELVKPQVHGIRARANRCM